MRFLTCIVLFTVAWVACAVPPARIKQGDTFRVIVPAMDQFNAECTVLDDGAIYGAGFGRLVVVGKTFDEVQRDLRAAMSRYVKENGVFLVLAGQAKRNVFIIAGASGGPVEYEQGRSLRHYLAASKFEDDPDQHSVGVYRGGKKVLSTNLSAVLRSEDESLEFAMQADDIVTVTPIETCKVWVTGYVKNPSQVRLPENGRLSEAIIKAGGAREEGRASTRPDILGELKAVLRRGEETMELPVSPLDKFQDPVLQDGDLIVVVKPATVRVVLSGEVAKPGEYEVDENATILHAIALAGGPASKSGSLQRVLIFRKGEMLQVDASDPSAGKPQNPITIESGDLVYVCRNERMIYVFGEVAKPGTYMMEDHKRYHVTDALAMAGGLGPKGVLRRVFLARSGPDGKVKVTQFNLDEYMKKGKLEANPEMMPGDALLFGQPSGINIGSIAQVLTSLVLLENLFDR